MKNIETKNFQEESEFIKSPEKVERESINKLTELKWALVDWTIMDSTREVDYLEKMWYTENKEFIANIHNSYQKHLVIQV